MLLKQFAVYALLVCTSWSAPVWAQDGSPQLKAAVERNTQGKVKVDAVAKTPVSGIYEISSAGDVFYVDETGRYAFVDGRLMDLVEQKDLTAVKLDKINAIDFNTLPLKYALKEVCGTGKRQVAVFEDPNCPICRVFHKFIAQLDDVTVYKFMFPVISPASGSLARIAWCSKNRAATWEAIMNGARPTGSEDCDVQGLVATLKLGEKYQINNTPTVILGNGKRLVGATPPEQFMTELNASVR